MASYRIKGGKGAQGAPPNYIPRCMIGPAEASLIRRVVWGPLQKCGVTLIALLLYHQPSLSIVLLST